MELGRRQNGTDRREWNRALSTVDNPYDREPAELRMPPKRSIKLSEWLRSGEPAPLPANFSLKRMPHGVLPWLPIYNGANPVNLGSVREITIINLVNLIAKMTGYEGRLSGTARSPNASLGGASILFGRARVRR